MSSHSGEKFRVVGGAHLKGDVHVSGAKNSVLKLMAAALLAPGKTELSNVPEIADVERSGRVLNGAGFIFEAKK